MIGATAMQGTMAVLLAAWPAVAGWNYTEWDMTPEAVVESSQGKVTLLENPVRTDSHLVKLAEGEYRTSEFVFHVSFLFRSSDNILDRVTLVLTNPEAAPRLYPSLVSAHGDPIEESIKSIPNGQSHTAAWLVETKNQKIKYFGVGDYYAIEFAPLTRAFGDP